MPVSEPTDGALSGLRNPEVIDPSVVDGAVRVSTTPVKGSTNAVPGKMPFGLPVVGTPLKLGWEPPERRDVPPSTMFPRVQLKPSARLSFWLISANLVLMLICGGAWLRV